MLIKTPEHLDSMPRIAGYDLARALAIFGMMIINFNDNMSDCPSSEWFSWLTDILRGRATAAFIILAGVGLSLLSHRARIKNNTADIIDNRNTLLRRAAFLFIIGLLYGHIWWPADILHFYGIYIAIGAFLLTVSDRCLWLLASAFVATSVTLMLLFNYGGGWDFETVTYIDFWTPEGMIRHLLFNGYYPVFPFAAFLMVGIWVGRQDIHNPALRRRILLASVATVCMAEGVSWLLFDYFLMISYKMDTSVIFFLIRTEPDPSMPLYILSAGGTGLIVIIFSIMLTERFAAARWLKPFISVGQLSLTIYLAHVIIGMDSMEMLGMLENRPQYFAVENAMICYAGCLLFAFIWKKRFDHGPLEWVMRRLSSEPKMLTAHIGNPDQSSREFKPFKC